MGRRKSKRKPPPKRKAIEPLDVQFNCPFCNHEKSCEVKIHLKCLKNDMLDWDPVGKYVVCKRSTVCVLPVCRRRRSNKGKYWDKARNTARITCRVCLEDFQTSINFLSEPVDVYNDWIDACESAN